VAIILPCSVPAKLCPHLPVNTTRGYTQLLRLKPAFKMMMTLTPDAYQCFAIEIRNTGKWLI